jgi:hypothetical protein
MIRTVNFSYDLRGQLTGVTGWRTENYTFDALGNRTMSGYQTGTGGAFGTWPYLPVCVGLFSRVHRPPDQRIVSGDRERAELDQSRLLPSSRRTTGPFAWRKKGDRHQIWERYEDFLKCEENWGKRDTRLSRR